MSMFFFFFKQKTAYEMRISDWSSDVCSSDLAKKIYCWEEDGHKVCGDALPADAVDAARTEISARTGHTVRSLERAPTDEERAAAADADRKSTRLNSSH